MSERRGSERPDETRGQFADIQNRPSARRSPRKPAERTKASAADKAKPQPSPSSKPEDKDSDSTSGTSSNKLITSENAKRAKEFCRRHLLELALGSAFGVVAVRLGILQTLKSGAYGSLAKIERTANERLYHRRGAIYDRNGIVLAQSVDAKTIYANPSLIPVTSVNLMANTLAEVLGGAANDYAQLISNHESTFVYVKKRAEVEVADRLKARLAELGLTGIFYLEDSKRVYPMGELAGNVVGAIGEEGKGLFGLELYYDDILTGVDGKLVAERGIDGDPIVDGQYERVDPIDGQNIVVSIDVDIQRAAQEQLATIKEEWGSGDGLIIVMQPETGELLACASTPFVDPSRLDLATTEALKLRGICDSYEPGSTVKPITASMAIDLGIATPDTTYWAPANIQVGTDWVGDADERNYEMEMSLTNMLERSSNVGAVLCAESVGPQAFSEYFDRYQIGSLTGVDYPGESMGIVPQLEDYTGAWMSMAFGQGVSVPPIQMVKAIGAIANEGILPQPHFLISKNGEEVAYEQGERAIDTATAEQVAYMMKSVVDYGYAYTGAIPGYNLSAKTGTAERVDPNTGTYSLDHYTVSFMGFGPTEDPKVLTYVLIDNVDAAHEGTTVGAPWAAVMQAALTKLEIPPSY